MTSRGPPVGPNSGRSRRDVGRRYNRRSNRLGLRDTRLASTVTSVRPLRQNRGEWLLKPTHRDGPFASVSGLYACVTAWCAETPPSDRYGHSALFRASSRRSGGKAPLERPRTLIPETVLPIYLCDVRSPVVRLRRRRAAVGAQESRMFAERAWRFFRDP
jgi:hypothetical protein